VTADDRPTLHFIAGPNGAGKTTLYETELRPRYPALEFVNADRLAEQRFGHPARTARESAVGQELAEERRRALMTEGRSLVTESTFSHPSKLELLHEARASGYRVVLYHVNLGSPELSVLRVAHRVGRGGHPVPEDRIRARFQRNRPLIRDAALLADRAYVFDNSGLARPHRLVLTLVGGRLRWAAENLPDWVQALYGPVLISPAPAEP